MPGSAATSSASREPRLFWSADGDWILFAAPIEGAYELWGVAHGDCGAPARLTEGEHAITRPDAVPFGGAAACASPRSTFSGTETPDVRCTWTCRRVGRAARDTRQRGRDAAVSSLMAKPWDGVEIVAPVSRWHEVDGRRIQGWFLEAPRRDGKPAPLVVEIHGGPATLYGWSMFWEWQVLVAAGISVYACNPRGSQGYGQDFCYANFRDWGDGPDA